MSHLSAARTIAIALFLGAAMAVALPASAETATGILGFQAWKAARVEEAKATLDRIETTQTAATPAKAPDSKTAAKTPAKTMRPDPRLQQAQINFEIAQELTVSDYFVLYLSQYKDRDSLIEAAKKLTPEEVADLMAAYQKQLAGGAQTDASVAVPSAISGLAPAVGEKPARAAGL